MDAVGGGSGGGQRRFRQRGGAKKKKKPRALGDGEQPSDTISAPQDAPYNPRDHSYRGCEQSDGGREQSYGGREQSYASREQSYGARAYGSSEVPAWRESQLDPELARYLYQLRDDLDRMGGEGGADGEEEESPSFLLARNGLASLHANLHEVSMEPMGSRVLESLIRLARRDAAAIAATLSALLALGPRRVAVLADHRCGSHVLQALVCAVKEDETGCEEGLAAMTALGSMVKDWTAEDAVGVMCSSSGSHVFRAIVAALAGIPAEEAKETKLDDSAGSERIGTYIENGKVGVPREWLNCVSALAERLLEADDGSGLNGLLWAASSSAAFQGLLAAVSVADRDVAKRLVVAALKGSSMLDVCFDACGARFMERVVVCLGSGYVLNDLKGHFADMAVDGKANFVLQRVLLALKGRGSVMSAWDELEDSLAKMTGFGSARDGVVLAMLRAAEVEGDDQSRKRAARALAKSVGATGVDTKHLCGILLTGSLERWKKWREAVKEWSGHGMGLTGQKESGVLHFGASPGTSLLGVLMARSLLRFPGGPGQACRDSMANLTASEVLALASQPAGSRIVEQWILSDEEFGNGKAFAFFVNSVLDAKLMAPVCRSPYGAQVLIRAIPRAPGPVRKRAMEALASIVDDLKVHKHGRQVVRKCRVDDYIRRGDDWTAAESARDTRHRLFEDILVQDDAKTNAETPEVKRVKSLKKKKDVQQKSMSEEGAQKKKKKKRSKEDPSDNGQDLGNVLSAIAVAAEGEKKKRKKK